MFDEAIAAFLPTDGSWATHDFPHMTLVAAGPADDMNPSDWNNFAKDSISAGRVMNGAFSLPVTGVEELGDQEKVDALMLHPNPQLLVARNLMEKWNKSQFKDFLPHATIGPAGSAFRSDWLNGGPQNGSVQGMPPLPNKLWFNRLAVCLGPKRLVFDLNSWE